VIVFDRDGNKIQFANDGERLVIYINGAARLSFVLVEVGISGRIKIIIPWDRNSIYYVLDNGRRYRSLYIDPINKRIGTRRSLGAFLHLAIRGEEAKAVLAGIANAEKEAFLAEDAQTTLPKRHPPRLG
jgi:hypothetical protein